MMMTLNESTFSYQFTVWITLEDEMMKAAMW